MDQKDEDKISKLVPWDRRSSDTSFAFVLSDIIYKINEIIDEINRR